MHRLTRFITPTALATALAIALAFTLATGQVMAANSDPAPAKVEDPNFARAKQLVEDGNYDGAIPLLEQAVAADKENADAFNLLGYSNRQLGNNDIALGHYETALKLKPTHRGANEYLGELYLTLGDLAKAEERLDVLDGACFFGCEEYTELKKAIADYKAKTGS